MIFQYRIELLVNLNIFLQSFFRPKPKSIFGIHDSAGVRALFQLRLGLSPLRSHKQNHNSVDTPSAICSCNQGIEDTYHYLFTCPFYTEHRNILVSAVSDVLQKHNLVFPEYKSDLYLYGHPLINDPDNKAIILSTIIYIKKTNCSS